MLSALPEGLPLSLEAPVRSLAAMLTPVERAQRGRQAVASLLASVEARGISAPWTHSEFNFTQEETAWERNRHRKAPAAS